MIINDDYLQDQVKVGFTRFFVLLFQSKDWFMQKDTDWKISKNITIF